MIDSLLTFYAGKNNRKKKKILKILEDIKFNEITKEFSCKSLSNPNINHIVIFSEKKNEYICDCKEILYKPYQTYSDPKEKNRKKEQRGCSHILASKIYLVLNKKN